MEPMLYTTWRRNHKGKCPFCGHENNRIIKAGKYAYLTYSLAPYSKYHMLAIPRRHVVSFLKLTKPEEKDIDRLLEYGAGLLKKLGVKDFTILVRDGDNRIKTVPHLHYHLVPNHRIGDLDRDGRTRAIMTPREVDALMRRFRKLAN